MLEYTLHCGVVVKADEDTLPLLEAYRWRLNHAGYPMRTTSIKLGDKKVTRQFFLHREIAGAAKGQIADHINGDILDVRRENLRVTDLSGNARNQRKSPTPRSSQFKGVCWSKQSRKWQVQMKVKGARIYLGLFDCEHAAGHAYNKAAVAHFGEFAVLNPVGFGKE